MAIYNYGIGGNEVKVDANESIAEIPSNRTLIVQKLTDEAPAAPESVYGLETIEDVFQRFEPTVDLCHVDAEGNEIKEIMTFTGLGDFGAKKIKEKSDFLSKLDIEKEQGVRITCLLHNLPQGRIFFRTVSIKLLKLSFVGYSDKKNLSEKFWSS